MITPLQLNSQFDSQSVAVQLEKNMFLTSDFQINQTAYLLSLAAGLMTSGNHYWEVIVTFLCTLSYNGLITTLQLAMIFSFEDIHWKNNVQLF